MKLDYFVFFILIISFASFLSDPTFRNCIVNKNKSEQFQILVIIYIHHLIVTFAYLGWLTDNIVLLFIYLLTPILIGLHWLTNNYQCYFTLEINKLCGTQIGFSALLDNVPLGPFKELVGTIGLTVGFIGYFIGLCKFLRL